MKPFHKQRLVTRGRFLGFLKIFVSPQGPANKDWEPVCCFLGGGVVYNKFLKIFVSPQGPANKDWEPVRCFFLGGWGKNFAERARK